MITKTKAKKGMRFESFKGKVPLTNFELITKEVEERNKGKQPNQHIDESYIISELIIKNYTPA